MGIDEKMILIESMAKASLPVVGFTNFMIEKGSSVDVDVIGRRYLEIIKKYKCFGEGNRPHYLNVEMPGGSDGIVYRRFFDGLSGAQFYANRLYGVLALDFGAYDEQIDERALESVKEYLMFNKDNIRFILSNVPHKSAARVLRWSEFTIFSPSLEELSARDFLEQKYCFEGNEEKKNQIKAFECVLKQFPESSWERVIGFIEALDNDGVNSMIDTFMESDIGNDRRMGFYI